MCISGSLKTVFYVDRMKVTVKTPQCLVKGWCKDVSFIYTVLSFLSVHTILLVTEIFQPDSSALCVSPQFGTSDTMPVWKGWFSHRKWTFDSVLRGVWRDKALRLRLIDDGISGLYSRKTADDFSCSLQNVVSTNICLDFHGLGYVCVRAFVSVRFTTFKQKQYDVVKQGHA